MTTDEIITRWRAGETLEQIAEAAGVSKQAVSKRLIRAGFSPRERLYEQRAAEGSSASAERLERITEDAEARDTAARTLAEIAAKRGVTARSIAQAGDEDVQRVCAPYSLDYLAHLIPG